AIVICVGLPGSTADIGFQLSFPSVIAIVLGMRRFAAWFARRKRLGRPPRAAEPPPPRKTPRRSPRRADVAQLALCRSRNRLFRRIVLGDNRHGPSNRLSLQSIRNRRPHRERSSRPNHGLRRDDQRPRSSSAKLHLRTTRAPGLAIRRKST